VIVESPVIAILHEDDKADDEADEAADEAAQESKFESLRLGILATWWSLPWSKDEEGGRFLLGWDTGDAVGAVSAEILSTRPPPPEEEDGSSKKACDGLGEE
jgi:hypothetical protein